MSTQPKSPGGKPQSTAPQSPAQRKASDQKPQRKIAAEGTGAAKREEVLQKARAPAPVLAKQALSGAQVPELSKDAIKSAMDSIERSWKAAGLGTVAVNRKILDFARQNVSSGLHLARSLAGAKNPAEMARLHMSFWDEQMKALASQAEELRAMSADLVNKASEPLREHVRKRLSDLDR
jgi:hypothetical protein